MFLKDCCELNIDCGVSKMETWIGNHCISLGKMQEDGSKDEGSRMVGNPLWE